MSEHAKLMFRTRDSLLSQLAQCERELSEARRKHYSGKGALPRMENFRREIGA